MSTEFQVIFTAITSVLAGLSLFVLRGVYKKFEVMDSDMKDVKKQSQENSERLVKLETIISFKHGSKE
jgi:hypothetical protein